MKVAIVGAGIVGAACAHALLDEGHEVLILDRHGPAFGPSRVRAVTHIDASSAECARAGEVLARLLDEGSR